MNNKNGITLIALVITIIILIILAGVSIYALVGDNGVISQAMNAKKSYEDASMREELEMAWAARMSKFQEDLAQGKTTKELMYTYFQPVDINPLLKNGVVNSVTKNGKNFSIDYSTEHESFIVEMTEAGEVKNITILADAGNNGSGNEEPVVEEPVEEEPVIEEPAAEEFVIGDNGQNNDDNGEPQEISVEVAGAGNTKICYYENEKRIVVSSQDVNSYGEPNYEWTWPAVLIGMPFNNELNRKNLLTPQFETIKDNIEEVICDRDFNNLDNLSNLKTIDLTGVEYGWGGMFDGCTSLEKIYISSNFKIPSDTALTILSDCKTNYFTIRNTNGPETNISPSDLTQY